MYHGLGEIVDGFTKNTNAVFGDSTRRPVFFLLLPLAIGVAPFLWLFVTSSVTLGASLLVLLFCRTLVQLRLILTESTLSCRASVAGVTSHPSSKKARTCESKRFR